MWKVGSGKEILEIDNYVISELGVPSMLLMENAGLAVASRITEIWGNDCSVAVICGPGNNGADGLVVARKLSSLGMPVEVFCPYGEFKTEIANVQKKLCRDVYQIPIREGVPPTLSQDVIVDAILGAGASRDVDDATQKIFDSINNSGKPVVAVDIPSGICPTSGKLFAVRPVKAHTTVTFGLVKSGLIFYPGASYVGKLQLASICYPKCSLIELLSMQVTSLPELKPRDPVGHKGSFGKAFVLAGSEQYYGAPLLSALSFLKTGGGYVRLFCPPSVGAVVACSAPEIVQLGYSWSQGNENFLRESDVVIIGPGLGLSETSRENVRHSLNVLTGGNKRVKAVIFDGDGLTILAAIGLGETITSLTRVGIKVIVTPHQGEWRRLFNQISTPTLSEYEVAVKTYDIVKNSFPDLWVVAKGARTSTVSKDGIWINISGNSGMATCGSGDVLTGIVAAMICNLDCSPAAVAAGVFIHGLAGDTAGQEGLVASEIMNHVPTVLRKLRSESDRKSLKEKYFPSLV